MYYDIHKFLKQTLSTNFYIILKNYLKNLMDKKYITGNIKFKLDQFKSSYHKMEMYLNPTTLEIISVISYNAYTLILNNYNILLF